MTPQQMRESNAFRAPEHRHGQIVAFWPLGRPGHGEPVIAVISSQTGDDRTVALRLLGNREIRDSVPHATDPRLGWNDDHREFGCWEETDDEKHRIAEYSRLEERLKMFEDLMNAMEMDFVALKRRLDEACGDQNPPRSPEPEPTTEPAAEVAVNLEGISV